MGDEDEQQQQAVDTTTPATETPPTPQGEDDEKPVKDDDTVPEDSEPPKETLHKKMLNLRFLFANRDGLSVTIQCDPSDTVGEVKGALISMWPKEMPACTDGEALRLICMGKGFLTPDSRSLEELEIPSFKSHPTPINVTVRRPELLVLNKQYQKSSHSLTTPSAVTAQGCGCVIQ